MSNKTKNKVTEEQIDATIHEMREELLANPNPDAVRQLREKHGATFDITGDFVEVREPKRLRKAIKKELEEQQANTDEPRIKDAAQKFTRGASKTGEILAYTLVDAPVEGAKTGFQVVKSSARKFKEDQKAKHERRLNNAEKRSEARQVRKKEREEARARIEAEEASQKAREKAKHEARLAQLEKKSS